MLQTRPVAVTFAVDDVRIAEVPLPTCKPREAVQALLDAPSSPFAADESMQGNPVWGRVEACWNYSLDCVAGVGHHPLIAAAHLAFSEHRPLVLSPDVIWVTIAQGLAQHLRLDPEKYRPLLVRHEGRNVLTVERDDLHRGSPENPWAEVIAGFAALLRQEVGELAQRFICDFSTTGPVERTVSEVVLLDALQSYYSYNVVGVCGIPSVTLEGTLADWQKLRHKVEWLDPFGLDWWLRELRPICDQFVRAAAGDVDRDHWKRLYKIRAVYGAKVINGWLGKLFPYTSDYQTGQYTARNPLLDPEVEKEIRKLEREDARNKGSKGNRFHAPGIGAEDLPRGLSQVLFTLRDARGERAMDFLAGPMIATQDAETMALRPALGWAVREAPPIEQALLRLAQHELAVPADGPLDDRLRTSRLSYIPTDVVRFHQVADGASIHAGRYRILPLSGWCEPPWTQEWAKCSDKMLQVVRGDLLRFAHLADGTELVIRLFCPEGKNTGAVFVGRALDGTHLPDTGKRVAQSFTDFLLRALECGGQPYFRRPDFAPLGEPFPPPAGQ
jgi:hypothetical protein